MSLCSDSWYVMFFFGEYFICVYVNLNIYRILWYVVKCSYYCGSREVGKIYCSDFKIISYMVIWNIFLVENYNLK